METLRYRIIKKIVPNVSQKHKFWNISNNGLCESNTMTNKIYYSSF